jgi:hypothetical protein
MIDFKQTGDQLQCVISNLMEATIDVALVDSPCRFNEAGSLVCVYDKPRRARET